MNLGGKSYSPILYAAFNQDASCLSVGTKAGFKMYNCDPFGMCFSRFDGAIGLAEMLFTTNIMAIVGAGDQPTLSPRRLQIMNTKKNSVVCELTFPTTILSVKMNRRRLVVVLETSIYVYDISNMKLMHTIETTRNSAAICGLSSGSDFSYLACPAGKDPRRQDREGTERNVQPPDVCDGAIMILNADTLHPLTIIAAHRSPLSGLKFSHSGTLLATAGEKGTLIRVFSVPGGSKLYQFRRGTYPARIHSLSFSMDESLLACSSETETVHIFQLNPDAQVRAEPGVGDGGHPLSVPGNEEETNEVDKARQPGGLLKGLRGSLVRSGYLPDFVSDMVDPHRDFAHAKLPCGPGVATVVGFHSETKQLAV